jgi:hypothetical protein
MKKPIVLETFREVGPYELLGLKSDAPFCFNRIVGVKKYRVTVEEIQEPDSVIVGRIKSLWRQSGNHHDWEPLKKAAIKYGVELDHKELGIERRRK